MSAPNKPWNNDLYKERLKKRLAMETQISQSLFNTFCDPYMKDSDFYIGLKNIENSNFNWIFFSNSALRLKWWTLTYLYYR